MSETVTEVGASSTAGAVAPEAVVQPVPEASVVPAAPAACTVQCPPVSAMPAHVESDPRADLLRLGDALRQLATRQEMAQYLRLRRMIRVG
jgi:hypothetical protein